MLIDTPSPSNRVVLNGTGEPEVEYTLSDADKVRFRRGVAQAVRINVPSRRKAGLSSNQRRHPGWNTTGQLRPLILTESRQADAVERNLQFIPNRSIVTSAHLQATNELGASARDSVVSTDLKVWGTEGLYVVDGSIFPTSIGANSNAEHLYVCEDFCRQADSLSREQIPAKGLNHHYRRLSAIQRLAES